MALNPALKKMIGDAKAKYQGEPAVGIIPLNFVELDPKLSLICEVASMITDAINGPAISAFKLAEMIVDTVQDAG